MAYFSKTISRHYAGQDEKESLQLKYLPPEGGTTNFSFLALVDPSHRRDRAAKASRGLAAGVGSGDALSRNADHSMEQARPARKTRFAVAQRGRVRRRAVSATKKT